MHSEKLLRIEREHIEGLFVALKKNEYAIIGPTLGDNAILYEEISSSNDLPIGWADEHEAGGYRLKKRNDQALFGYNTGAHTWKKFLHPTKEKLWSADKSGNGFTITKEEHNIEKYAFIGVRSCELEAIKIQDKVFMGETYKNPRYAKRLENAFIVAINCVQASSNCFCTSMGGGAKTKSGFDIALTEVIDEDTHYFIAEAGTEKGKNILSELPSETAHDTEIKKAEEHIASAEAQISRKIDTNGIKELLYNNYEHPEWDKIADACLSCGNCTMACPTCFCTTVEDVTDLTGEHTERWQSWDSCFSADFSYIHGGNTRPSTKSHYRQWVTHKLATWIDQFGSSGCVGCGNCITWCPVGIDITESVKKIRGDGKT